MIFVFIQQINISIQQRLVHCPIHCESFLMFLDLLRAKLLHLFKWYHALP